MINYSGNSSGALRSSDSTVHLYMADMRCYDEVVACM